MPYEQAFGIGFGAAIGVFVGWLILPWVYPARDRRKARNRGEHPPLTNTEGPVTYEWQDARGHDYLNDANTRMRTGRKLGRTLYLKGDIDDWQHDKVVGMVDSVWLASEVCRRWNLQVQGEEVDADGRTDYA